MTANQPRRAREKRKCRRKLCIIFSEILSEKVLEVVYSFSNEVIQYSSDHLVNWISDCQAEPR